MSMNKMPINKIMEAYWIYFDIISLAYMQMNQQEKKLQNK